MKKETPTFDLPYSIGEKALTNDLPMMVDVCDTNAINTKKIQKALRIITSPIVFLVDFFCLMFFPIPMMFFIGIFLALGKVFGSEIDEDWKEISFLIFSFVSLPYMGAREWIIDAKLT